MIYFTTVEMISNTSNTRIYKRPFGDEAIVLSGIILFAFCLIGLVLNSLTVTVIRRTPQLQNIFMDFILSLCISDLMSAAISPLFWYRRTLGFDIWIPPNFLCKLYWATDIMTSISTALHIFNFAILRYLSIKHSSTFRRISKNTGKIWIASIWLIAFTCGFVPFWIFFGAEPGVPRDRYSKAPNSRWPSCTLELEWFDEYNLYNKVGYTIFLLLPMAGVIVFSFLIWRAVHARSVSSMVTNDIALKRRMRKEKQAVQQLALIVVSFLFGYIPYVTYENWSLTSTNAVTDYWFGLIEYFCLRFSECLNPIFYNVSSSKMRRHTKHFLKKVCRCPKIPFVTSETVSTQVPSSTSGGENFQMGV